MLREDSIVESAKQRSLRVPLDHFVRKDWIVRAKFLLTAVAAAVAALYIGWTFVGGQAGHQQASPGPLAAVHAGWDNDCQACHLNFKPLRSDAVQLTALGASRAAIRESLDQSCIKCHNEPEHHHAAKPDEVLSCSACHRDHLGRTANIVRPTDSTCLGCHQQIDQHRNGPSAWADVVKNVAGFGPVPASGEGPHPDFRSLGSDPGNLKFNHWLHMQPGAAVANAKAENKKTWNQLDEKFRPQYARFAKAGGLLELDCSACHEPDASGQYMRPIAFEQHCQACHPLQMEVAQGQPPTEVPHGLTAARLTAAIDGLLFEAQQKQTPGAPSADESGAAPLIPGRTLGSNLAQKINQDLLGRRASAAKAISAKCQECHETGHGNGSLAALPDLLPPNIPSQWLKHARFDHTAHRHVSCKDCHAEAYAFEQRDKPQFIKPGEGAIAARDSEKVMIARLEKCATCHAAAPTAAVGARHDCAECHNYHDRDKLTGPKHVALFHTSSFPGSTLSSFPGPTLSSFPGSTLGTQHPEAPASTNYQSLLTIRPVSFTSLAQPSSPIVGASSCASVGCHGDVREKSPAWQTSLSKFFASDPHAQAYDVLWTFRGREMTRLLAVSNKSDDQPLSDAAHFQAIQQRCIGCHATPLAEGAHETSSSYALGVHCESCHGPAGGWLHSHYQTSFARDASPGFNDTKQLDHRAAACMKCHVGPNHAAASPQVVDHDLIAAGHPRLAFEFHSYFQSLPAHWNREADEAKHPGAFHFRSWLAGQSHANDHKNQLNQERPGDFSNLDCFACHHSLAPDSWRQPAKFAALKPVAWPALLLPTAKSDASLADRLRLARDLFQSTTVDARWDSALQSYLATRAIAGDLRTNSQPSAAAGLSALDSALASLATYLGDTSFASRQRAGNERASHPPTPYDSPTAFSPASYAERSKPVLDALQQLEAATAR